MNFCPPTLTSNIRPPLVCVNTATPLLKVAVTTRKVVKLQCTGFRIDRRIGVIVPAFVRITLFVGQSQIQRDLDFLVTQVLRIESFGLASSRTTSRTRSRSRSLRRTIGYLMHPMYLAWQLIRL